MKVFWDTSAAINALVSLQVWARLDADEHFARVHLFSEFFSTMTGRGILVKDQAGSPARLVLTARDAATWLRAFQAKVKLIDLDSSETLDALENAQANNIQGGHVYDYLHALAAEKAQANLLLTRNIADFSGLARMPVRWP